LGTAQDLPKAWALASLAVERGDTEAKTLLGDITSKLSGDQLEKGKKELEELRKPKEESSQPEPSTPEQQPEAK
jgi:TPR repeat protein